MIFTFIISKESIYLKEIINKLIALNKIIVKKPHNKKYPAKLTKKNLIY